MADWVSGGMDPHYWWLPQNCSCSNAFMAFEASSCCWSWSNKSFGNQNFGKKIPDFWISLQKILKISVQPPTPTSAAGCGGLLLAPGPGNGGGAATAGHRARGGVDRGCETKEVSKNGCVYQCFVLYMYYKYHQISIESIYIHIHTSSIDYE